MKSTKKKSASQGLEIAPSRKASKPTKPLKRKSPRSKNVSAISLSASREGRQFHTPVAILRRLDIDPEELAAAPKVTDILIRCFSGKRQTIPRAQIVNYLSASGTPVARQFLAAWRSISKADLDRLSIEAVCVKAAVSPLALLGAVLMAAKLLKAQESALKAILAHPDVVDATVDTAKFLGPAGHADRKLLHEAIGFLPTKEGGMEINIGFGRPAEEKDKETDADDSWDDAFPPLGDGVKTWSAQKHALLEAGK